MTTLDQKLGKITVSLLFVGFSTFSLPEPEKGKCSWTSEQLNATLCPSGYSEIFKETEGNVKARLYCCTSGSKMERQKLREVTKCRATKCLNADVAAGDLCTVLSDRYFTNGTKLEYKEVHRDPCKRRNDGGPGILGLCCASNTLDALLVSTQSAEDNEFPHQAKFYSPNHCGGTIYNKRYIITAAHCVIGKDTGQLGNVSKMKVILGTNIAEADKEDEEYVYQIKNIIPHENYSRRAGTSEFEKFERKKVSVVYNDMALLELDRDITFADNIKALEIAPKNFDPFLYADQAIGLGWGATETLTLSIHLQKLNYALRTDEKCFDVNGIYGRYMDFSDQLLCIGGIMDGHRSATSGSGDSGGPAICRSESGHPVLCGINTFGGSDEKCMRAYNERNCPPSVYADVGFHHDWILEHAGPQKLETLYRPFLYGAEVPPGQYEHQVHITSQTGKSCGGTLVAPDVVVTAGQCVYMGNDSSIENIGFEVTIGLNSRNVSVFGVKNIVGLDDFERYFNANNSNAWGIDVFRKDGYYRNDLAVVKLDRKASVPKEKLPGLPNTGEHFTNGIELAFPRKSSKIRGTLMSREFKLIDNKNCQRRIDRLSKLGLSYTLEDGVFCGIEKYSGGSTCDRELGGGLICFNDHGKEVLCGVQIYRLCRSTLPSGFMNLERFSNFVRKAME